jgi:hypothetical protein
MVYGSGSTDEERSENFFGKKREEAIGMSCVVLEVVAGDGVTN